MSYCGECYYQGKKLKPCSTCWCGSEAKTECTNADRIRSMTDKEMSTDLITLIMEVCEDGIPCEELFLEWLQSEAE